MKWWVNYNRGGSESFEVRGMGEVNEDKPVDEINLYESIDINNKHGIRLDEARARIT